MREVGIAEDFTFRRWVAVDQVGCARIVELLDHCLATLERGHVALPVKRNELRDRKAIARIGNGGREVVCNRKLAELLVHREPAVDSSRYRNRQRTEGRNVRLVRLARLGSNGANFIDELLKVAPLRGSPRAVVAVKPLGLWVPNDREEVATNPVGDGLDQSENG